ncbi:9972_t:CDS:2, partial [Racocetra fulgida]
ANEEYVESTICIPSDFPLVFVDDPIPDENSAQEIESSLDVEDGTIDGQGAKVSQNNNNLIEESEVNNDPQPDSDSDNEINEQ